VHNIVHTVHQESKVQRARGGAAGRGNTQDKRRANDTPDLYLIVIDHNSFIMLSSHHFPAISN